MVVISIYLFVLDGLPIYFRHLTVFYAKTFADNYVRPLSRAREKPSSDNIPSTQSQNLDA